RATDPSTVTKSWAGWIIHHVEHDTSFAGEVAFQEWRRRTLARLEEPHGGSHAGSRGGARAGVRDGRRGGSGGEGGDPRPPAAEGRPVGVRVVLARGEGAG